MKACCTCGDRKRAKARYIPVAIPMAQSRDGLGRFGRITI